MAPVKRGELSETEKNIFSSVQNGQTDEVKRLLCEPGVRVDCLDENGMTPLQHASYKANCELVRLFLAHGADINCSEHEHSYSTLMFAALSGNTNVTQLVLEAGARTSHVNSVGRNASQMAAFVGQHQVVSLINNFFAREDLEYYTVPRGLETEPKLPPELAPALYNMILMSNLNPVGLSLYLQDNESLVKQGNKLARLLDLLCEKMMKRSDTNEVMAVKFHYLASLLKHCYQAPSMSSWIKILVKGRESDGFPESQEKLIRSTLKDFPYIECQLLQQLIRNLAPVKIGDEPTALTILVQGVNGQRFASADTELCETCGKLDAQKKCSACKMVHYCDQRCQKLQWSTHKRSCKELAVVYEQQQIIKKQEEAKAKEEAAKKKEEEEEARKKEEESGEKEEAENKGTEKLQEQLESVQLHDSGKGDAITQDVPKTECMDSDTAQPQTVNGNSADAPSESEAKPAQAEA